MSGITDLLLSQIGGGQLEQIAGALGVPKSATERALEAAIPAMIGGLAKNALASPSGAASLASALDRDHDGSLLDNMGPLLSMLGGGKSSGGLGGLLGAAGSLLGGGSRVSSSATNGAGILKHVFGDRQSTVEKAVGKASGLDAAQVGKLLMMVAPLVMAALGKVKNQKGLDASALAGLLGQEKESLTASQPALGGLMGMLDADGDGDITDDVANLGAGLLKGFLSRK